MSTETELDFIVTPEILLKAYAVGLFPMAESADDPSIHWVEPKLRGIIPLDTFHISSKLRRIVKSDKFSVRVNHNFAGVMQACSEATPDRPSTWINARIHSLYTALYKLGHCHCVEVYQEERLVGGLYGVSLGGAFFGESMFHRATDASKVALVHLVQHLKACGFILLDTQFITDHLKQFGAVEIKARHYRLLLNEALAVEAEFNDTILFA